MVQDGRLVYETYRNGMTESDRHVAHSCSKTLTTMMVGIALEEGRLDRSGPMTDYVPELAEVPAWHPVTLEHVLDMATGIDLEEHYENADSMYWRYADAVGYYADGSAPRGGTLAFATSELTRTAEPPGVRFNYGSYLTNLLPIALANVYGVPAVELYEDRIYRHLGAEQPALVNLDSDGNPIVEGQVNLTLRDFVRWGYLLVGRGPVTRRRAGHPCSVGRRHLRAVRRTGRGVRSRGVRRVDARRGVPQPDLGARARTRGDDARHPRSVLLGRPLDTDHDRGLLVVPASRPTPCCRPPWASSGPPSVLPCR